MELEQAAIDELERRLQQEQDNLVTEVNTEKPNADFPKRRQIIGRIIALQQAIEERRDSGH